MTIQTSQWNDLGATGGSTPPPAPTSGPRGALSLIVVIGLCLAAGVGYHLNRAESTSGLIGPAIVGAAAWPVEFGDFHQLIGNAPGAVSGFDGEKCATVKAPLPLVNVARCTSAAGPAVTVVQYADAGDVQKLLDTSRAEGAAVTTWNEYGGANIGYVVDRSTGDGAEVITTFYDHPTVVVDMISSSSLTRLEDVWSNAPLPN